jgi:hypothetical protein
MQRSALVAEVIVQIDHDSVANSGFYARDWPLPIDSYDGSCVQTIRVSIEPFNSEVVCASLGCRKA